MLETLGTPETIGAPDTMGAPEAYVRMGAAMPEVITGAAKAVVRMGAAEATVRMGAAVITGAAPDTTMGEPETAAGITTLGLLACITAVEPCITTVVGATAAADMATNGSGAMGRSRNDWCPNGSQKLRE